MQSFAKNAAELNATTIIKEKISKKSQCAFQFRCMSKVKKGVAGTGKSDFINKSDGLKIIL